MFGLEAAKILADVAQVNRMAEHYFASSYVRMPILSKARFFRELPRLFANPQADFILLCLSINLLMQRPNLARHIETMQSSLYVSVKTYLASLEATNYITLNSVQAMVLVTFYEMGHAIYPAASASIASCARLAHFLGLNRKDFQSREHENDVAIRATAEEEKRTWWAIMNLDR
jgi:Fungal specific transcription factor domain